MDFSSSFFFYFFLFYSEDYFIDVNLLDAYTCPKSGRHSRTFVVRMRARHKALSRRRSQLVERRMLDLMRTCEHMDYRDFAADGSAVA